MAATSGTENTKAKSYKYVLNSISIRLEVQERR
jgi:hypothetical protein